MTLFVLGVGLIVVAVAVIGCAIRPIEESQGIGKSLAVLEAMSGAPRQLTDPLEPSFGDRVLQPLRDRAGRLAERLSGRDGATRIQARLDLAGNPAGWSIDRVQSGRVLAAAAGLAIGTAIAMVLVEQTSHRMLVGAAGLVLGFFAPGLYLYQLSYSRAEQIQRELPEALDLMTISVEAGLGFDAAVQQVATKTTGPLADEFARMLAEIQLGMPRGQALRALGERTTVTDVRAFVSAMVQADAFGVPVANVLRVQSAEIRVRRRQRAEEKAQQVPVKITVPLIFCILPALFVAVMGPAVISVMDSLV